jgi:hypothetical protein
MTRMRFREERNNEELSSKFFYQEEHKSMASVACRRSKYLDLLSLRGTFRRVGMYFSKRVLRNQKFFSG